MTNMAADVALRRGLLKLGMEEVKSGTTIPPPVISMGYGRLWYIERLREARFEREKGRDKKAFMTQCSP